MITAGLEFGESLRGKVLIVQGGWYGHKSAAATFHERLSNKLRLIGFKPTLTDQDLWIRTRHGKYKYLASYVDDVIIIINPDPISIIDDLKRTYVLKGVGVPEYYFGGNFDSIIHSMFIDQGIKTAMGARTYSNIVERFERMFDGPIHTAYTPMRDEHPEVDTSPVMIWLPNIWILSGLLIGLLCCNQYIG
jgi:hypothetical protein